jgi:hypothetical protein
MKLTQIMNENQENRPLSNEVKKHFLEIVSTYNKYQESLDRKSDIQEIAETLGGITEAARTLAIHEGDDWFDKHTIKRNMSELEKLGKEFDKCAVEAKSLDQRLGGLYEDMGNILSRYYKMGDITEEQMKERLGMNESKSDCGCGCGGVTEGGCSTNEQVVIVSKRTESGNIVSRLKEENELNESSVVGKTIFSDGKGKLFFGYYKTDDAVEFVDYKTWKKLSFKDVSKGDTNKERLIKAIVRNQKQFNKKVDFNMWAKKQKRSFEDIMDWFIQNGWINNINKGGIKESVDVVSVNEENPGLWANIRAKQKRGEKPAHKNSQAHKDAVKAGKKINNEAKFGYKDSTASYINKHKDEYKVAEKMNNGNEKKFYDMLQQMEEKVGHGKTMLFISNALRGYGVDMFKDPKIKNPQDAQEALFLLSK